MVDQLAATIVKSIKNDQSFVNLDESMLSSVKVKQINTDQRLSKSKSMGKHKFRGTAASHKFDLSMMSTI